MKLNPRTLDLAAEAGWDLKHFAEMYDEKRHFRYDDPLNVVGARSTQPRVQYSVRSDRKPRYQCCGNMQTKDRKPLEYTRKREYWRLCGWIAAVLFFIIVLAWMYRSSAWNRPDAVTVVAMGVAALGSCGMLVRATTRL